MSQKKLTPQDSQKKVSIGSKVSKTVRSKPRTTNPSIVLREKNTKGRKMPSACFEDGLAEDIQAKIAERAHELFEQRGRVHGDDWEDWLNAENEFFGENRRF